MTKQKTLLIVDGDGLLTRAHMGGGHNYLMGTQKVGGILSTINKIRYLNTNWDADSFQIAFDPFGKTTFRHKEYKDYKANRPPKEEDLIKAKIETIALLKLMGATVLEDENYEADDLVATAAKKGLDAGYRVIVVSKDKDMCSLLKYDNLIIVHPFGDDIITKPAVKEKYGIDPEQMDDLLAMWGDTADNIPGITKCGQGRGSQLLQKYNTIENIIEAAKNGDIKGVLGKNIIAEGTRALAFRKFLSLRTDISNVPHPDNSTFKEPNYVELEARFSKLGFNDLAQEARSNISTSPSP